MMMLIVVSASALAPISVQAEDYEGCLIVSGCIFDEESSTWICPNPATFVDCFEPRD
jgi:hypothetical protein